MFLFKVVIALENLDAVEMAVGRVHRSPRRRFRSATAEARRAPEKVWSCLYSELELQVAQYFDQTRSLPPFFRASDQTPYRLPNAARKLKKSNFRLNGPRLCH
ncbi:hypothetical protein Q1695_013333 [Nippostrongylus brasiliensis]|nr:hypothetical protein Q1695_013333 [Nippostrongylus brasiliensis]